MTSFYMKWNARLQWINFQEKPQFSAMLLKDEQVI